MPAVAQGFWYEAARVKEYTEAYNKFVEMGVEFTRGYLEGRKWRISNLFSIEHQAAREALEDLTGVLE